MQNDWAYSEIYWARLWDPRCYHTLASALQRLGEHAELSFSRALGSQRKAISHILHQQQTSAHDLLQGHIAATKRRSLNTGFILIASDTTSADFTTHSATQGLGLISSNAHQRGFWIHSALAMTPEGIPLGVLHQKSWVRDPEELGRAKERRQRAFEDKESHKWVEALQGVENALPTQQRALLIQDREADIFDFFCAPRRKEIALLIRATQPRRVETTDPNAPRTLFAVMEVAPVVAQTTVSVRARPDRPAREAHLTIRVARVSICAPVHGKSKADPVAVTMVRASEEHPPEGVKEPLEWVLLTTLAVPDAATAQQIVGYYAKRWLIERFHFVLKSGCGFERLQLDTFETLHKALSLYSIVAWRLLYLTYLAREAPDTPAEEAISSVEREVLERATGRQVKTVKDAVLAVARIAGFRPVPSAPIPGVKSLWLGFRQLNDMVTGFQLARLPPPHP